MGYAIVLIIIFGVVMIISAPMLVDEYGKDYQDILQNRDFIKDELVKEVEKFSKALEEGHREFD